MKTVLIAVLVFFTSSCACFNKSSKSYNTPQCVVSRDGVDCTVTAAESLGPALIGILESLTTHQASIDWAAILKDVEGASIRDGGCLLARIELYFAGKIEAAKRMSVSGNASATNDLATLVIQHEDFKKMFDAWRVEHQLVGVSFNFSGGQVAR